MGFDPKTFQRCAKLRSQEVVDLIVKHSWDLFVSIIVPCLKRLVLEAVAFGFFLWDMEGYDDSVSRVKET
ncbi:hypothetical protein QJS04_geneDACA004480 [Acorus gramineus]|uniref:Uncharacterized protein n=1 Tax=Acorus gramineus TaxID=55184 RepID=A0AAV9B650_ACOGR|nr:hypothetical protein QJS04_geneDACA004480 [Acorus gramineus]